MRPLQNPPTKQKRTEQKHSLAPGQRLVDDRRSMIPSRRHAPLRCRWWQATHRWAHRDMVGEASRAADAMLLTHGAHWLLRCRFADSTNWWTCVRRRNGDVMGWMGSCRLASRHRRRGSHVLGRSSHGADRYGRLSSHSRPMGLGVDDGIGVLGKW